MAWYFGPDNEWTPQDLENCDFAYDLIDSGIFGDYTLMAEYLENHAEDMIEITSTENGQGYFDTSFEVSLVAFDLMTMTVVGDKTEDEE